MAVTALTGETVTDLFKELTTDSSISQEFALSLIQTAKDEIEEERAWRMLLVLDSSNTRATSDAFGDAVSLPDDFRAVHKIALVNSDNNEEILDIEVPYEDLILRKDNSRAYSIDYANENLYILNNISESKTIYINYFKFTDDIAWATSPVWPSRFHKIIAYRMAEIWLRGVDADSLTRQQAVMHQVIADRMYKNMKKWDTRNWLKSMNNRTGFGRSNRGSFQDGHIQDFNR